MFLTNLLLKNVKSKKVMVQVTSMSGSGHFRNWIRERVADKLELIMFDPIVQADCLYTETKKVRSFHFKKRYKG